MTPDTLTSGATTPEPFDLESDITGHEANRTDEELTFKLHQLAGPASESSAGEEEEVVDGGRDAGSDGQREDRDEEDERLWRMEIDWDEGRTEDEEKEEDDEEMKYRLYRLVAQSRLTYFSSTDDELDKVGQSEGDWEGDKDEGVEEENKEQTEEKTDRLTYKLCQLEKEVRANQFSSTEDELDRVGVMDEEKKTGEEEEEEEDGKNEELAVKVCRLANQVNATQFSSTEDELDSAGRGEEGDEAIDEETLWKLQAEKAVQAAQLRDLSSLVSAAQFSSNEDQLDGDEENEVDNEGGTESNMWPERRNQERRESLGDLDVKMFDLRDEIEERKEGSSDEKATAENVWDGQTKQEVEDSMEESVAGETEDEGMVKGRTCEVKVDLKEAEVAKESEERQEEEAERTEEIIALHETKVQQENQPEAKWPDRKEAEERREEEKIRESKESQEKLEAAEDSDEEEAEFDRIISSMLMMTLEDMQGATTKDEAAGNGSLYREPEEVATEEDVKTRRESGFASEETGNAKESQSGGDNVMPETAVKERPGENVSQQTGGDGSRREESGNENEQQKVVTETQEKRHLAKEKPVVTTIEETHEDKQKCQRLEVEDDEQEDRERKVTTMMETQGGTAEGGCDSKETDERLEETKEEDKVEQSSASSPQEGLLSPEEIQIVSTTITHVHCSVLK